MSVRKITLVRFRKSFTLPFMLFSLLPSLSPRTAPPGLLIWLFAALGSIVLLLRGPGRAPADLHED